MPTSASYTQLVSFGDSMSDNGFDNGHGFQRCSNGRVWGEYLGEFLGIEDVQIRAWSGASSGMGNAHPASAEWSGLLWQLEQYQPCHCIEKTLFTIEIGINDFYNAPPTADPHCVVGNLSQFLKELIAKGARSILLWDFPQDMIQPAYCHHNSPDYDELHSKLDTVHSLHQQANQLLPSLIKQLEVEYPEVDIFLFGINQNILKIQKHFSNTTTPWHGSHEYPEIGVWMWWDDWHWMTETHRMVAEAIYRDVFLQS